MSQKGLNGIVNLISNDSSSVSVPAVWREKQTKHYRDGTMLICLIFPRQFFCYFFCNLVKSVSQKADIAVVYSWKKWNNKIRRYPRTLSPYIFLRSRLPLFRLDPFKCCFDWQMSSWSSWECQDPSPCFILFQNTLRILFLICFKFPLKVLLISVQ